MENPRSQTPNSKKTPDIKLPRDHEIKGTFGLSGLRAESHLGLGNWNFFGIWSLVFGISLVLGAWDLDLWA